LRDIRNPIRGFDLHKPTLYRVTRRQRSRLGGATKMARGEVGKGEDLRDVLPGHEGGCDLSAMPLLDLLFEVNCPLCRWSVLLPVRKGGKLVFR